MPLRAAVSSLHACLVLVTLAPVFVTGFSEIGELSVAKPATLNWYGTNVNGSDPLDKYSLLVDTQNNLAFTNDNTYIFRNVGRFIGDLARLQRTQVSNGFNFPRNIAETPASIFPDQDTITHTDGADILGKRGGAVHIVDVTDWSDPIKYNIASIPITSPDYEYTNVVWLDANRDSRPDAFTCRIALESGVSEFLYLQQPLVRPLTLKWTDYVLANQTCGSFVASATLTVQVGPTLRNFEVFFTVGYNSKDFSVYWTNAALGTWDDPAQIGHRVIASNRQYFDVRVFDINNDLQPELLVTVKDANTGSLEIVEIPADFRTDNFIFHPVMTGISTTGNRGAPGQVRVFKPIPSDTSSKWWLLLAGADQGSAYYFSPLTSSPTDWTWLPTRFVDLGINGDVAGVEAADVDGDGFTELFVSIYNRDVIKVFTFK